MHVSKKTCLGLGLETHFFFLSEPPLDRSCDCVEPEHLADECAAHVTGCLDAARGLFGGRGANVDLALKDGRGHGDNAKDVRGDLSLPVQSASILVERKHLGALLRAFFWKKYKANVRRQTHTQ